jgi:hypothetical protein
MSQGCHEPYPGKIWCLVSSSSHNELQVGSTAPELEIACCPMNSMLSAYALRTCMLRSAPCYLHCTYGHMPAGIYMLALVLKLVSHTC